MHVLPAFAPTALLAATSPPSGAGGGTRWTELIRITLEDGALTLHFGFLFLLLLLLAAIVVVLLRRWGWQYPGRWEATGAKVKFGGVEFEIAPNNDTIRIAHEAWVEIMTRKVGLPFDEENDVIVEVYDSWYAIFGVLRDLTKSVPAHRVRKSEDTRRLVEVMFKVLNEGLRPHLTRWQAKFRRWYEQASRADENTEKTPQQIQRQYPEYEELVADLKEVNGRFVTFAESLRRLSQGGNAEPE